MWTGKAETKKKLAACQHQAIRSMLDTSYKDRDKEVAE